MWTKQGILTYRKPNLGPQGYESHQDVLLQFRCKSLRKRRGEILHLILLVLGCTWPGYRKRRYGKANKSVIFSFPRKLITNLRVACEWRLSQFRFGYLSA
jgi:hypothetical protein